MEATESKTAGSSRNTGQEHSADYFVENYESTALLKSALSDVVSLLRENCGCMGMLIDKRAVSPQET